MSKTVKYVLDESRIPKPWYNIVADLPGRATGRAAPGHPQARRPRRPGAAVPDGTDPAGGHAGARGRDPGAGARRLPPMAAVPAVPCAPPRAGAADAGTHLLQVRGRVARRQPQAEHGRAAGVLQQAGRREAPDHRDRRGAVGLVAGIRRRALRPRGAGVHGARLVQPEAVPPRADGNLRRALRRLAVQRDGVGPRDPGEVARTTRAASASRSPRRSNWRCSATTPSTRSAACSTTCCCTRPCSASRRWRSSRWRTTTPTSSSAARGRLQLRGHRVPVPGRAAARRPQGPHRRGRARGLPEPHARHLCLRLRRHGAPHAAHQDAHARLDVHAARVPCRRPALSRHGAAREPREATRPDRGEGLSPEELLRGGRAVRACRGDRAGARGQPRRARRDRRGDPLPRGRRVARHPVQPLRARPLRHAGVHRLLRRQARGPRLRRASELAMALAGLPSVPEPV